ncbi:hypothetical protein EVAR_27396_1 [Eumeta japonica]|uniref:Uncharacterized protein n=1 Tax=Eumeta variegata TaxID=151549 RepID=A0A4C1X0V4_EUMVA|nr:hypothetical protein EVAR_27396_1 [Eumeta japonica]
MCLCVPPTESVASRTASYSGGAVVGFVARVTALPAYLVLRSTVRLRVPVLLALTTAGYIDKIAYRYGFPTNIHPVESNKDVTQFRLALQNDRRDTVLTTRFVKSNPDSRFRRSRRKPIVL